LQSQPLGANVIATLRAAQHFLKMHFAAAGAPCIEHLFAAVVAGKNLVGRGDHVVHHGTRARAIRRPITTASVVVSRMIAAIFPRIDFCGETRIYRFLGALARASFRSCALA
jgi:hypothetical protein